MSHAAYYNEIDPFAAQWLRNLIAAGHIAPGDVDERSIREVQPSDLIGYNQCHFFAGIGVWSHALRRAGWDDARPVWTGSCPCQPFSAAGKRTGTADDRHLWPEFFRLIGAHRPHVVFGEQVASKDGLAWLDAVQADLEGADYAFGSVDLCAAGFGAPHIRQRLYFVADAEHGRHRSFLDCSAGRGEPERGRKPRELAYADGGDASAEGLQRGGEHGLEPQDGGAGGLANDDQDGREVVSEAWLHDHRQPGHDATGRSKDGELADSVSAGRSEGRAVAGNGPIARGGTSSFWSNAEWLPCIDGKARPVEPGTFPLAHGIAGRVGRLRAYGNAIVAPAAEGFIRAYREVRNET